MRDFQVLFDHGEHSERLEPALARYGKLGFPAPPEGRPWIYSNFVQSLDGVVSLLGEEAGGFDLCGMPEDRWLMDLLRANADAVMLGMGTLREERRMQRPRPRGPVFRIVDPELQRLRETLGRGRERNVFVSLAADFQFSDYAVFDGDRVDVTVISSAEGAARLEAQRGTHPWVEVLAVGFASGRLDLGEAVQALTERHGVRYLLCEGGPKLYSGLLVAGLIDEQFLTVAPVEVGRRSAQGERPSRLPEVGFSRAEAAEWRWLSCRRVGDTQFHRFRRKPSGIC